MAKIRRKQTAISLKMKMELLKAVDEKRRSKTEICKEFGIANSTLSTILKKRDQIMAMLENCTPERKRFRTAKHEELETALLLWFKQVKSQNAPISGPLMLKKANEIANQMGIEFSVKPGWLERFKKRNGIALKNVWCEPNQVLPTVTTDWLPSTAEEYSYSSSTVEAEEEYETVETKYDVSNAAVHVPTKSEMRNIMKSMRSYLDAHSNGEMNNLMDIIEQFVESLMLRKTIQKKITDYFPIIR